MEREGNMQYDGRVKRHGGGLLGVERVVTG